MGMFIYATSCIMVTLLFMINLGLNMYIFKFLSDTKRVRFSINTACIMVLCFVDLYLFIGISNRLIHEYKPLLLGN